MPKTYPEIKIVNNEYMDDPCIIIDMFAFKIGNGPRPNKKCYECLREAKTDEEIRSTCPKKKVK